MRVIKMLDSGAACLRKVSQPVKFPLDEQTLEDISKLKQAFRQSFMLEQIRTLGLSAPQIGVNKRLFIIPYNINYGSASLRILKATVKHFEVFINPVIINAQQQIINFEETCLSLYTGTIYSVLRPRVIEVQYFNVKGEKIGKKMTGIKSRIYQHERDHLDGILMSDIGKQYTPQPPVQKARVKQNTQP